MKKNIYFIFILFSVNIVSETTVTRDMIRTSVLNSYYMRVEDDELKRLESLKSWLQYHSKEMGLTYDQLICSTKVILKSIEPDIYNWPKRAIEEKNGKRFIILLYTLCINGDSDAMVAMTHLLHGVNGNKGYSKFAAEALLCSPIPWFPVAKNIIDSGSGELRYLLCAAYLKRYVLEQRKYNEIKDSVAQIVCQGIVNEINPSILISEDSLLSEQFPEDYRHCKERAFVLKQRLENKKFQEYLSGHTFLNGDFHYLENVRKNVLQNPALHSSPRFRKLFKINEDLDTVDLMR